MPQVTVYVREEDLEKWKSIPKKAEFIHNALNENKYEKLAKESAFPNINQPIKACKHGYDPKMCKHAKPGKPCGKK